MYFSRVRLAVHDLDHRSLLRLGGGAYAQHQLLWKLFPGQRERPFLYRQERDRPRHGDLGGPRDLPVFYVLSAVAPQAVAGLFELEVKPFAPRLREGELLAFRLRANPTVARREEGRKNARHHDVMMDAKRAARDQGVGNPSDIRERTEQAARAWLLDEARADRCGYRLRDPVEVAGYRQHVQRVRDREIRFSSVDYEGVLEVADAARFTETLARGIGRGRAFGCGLLMVRRMRS